MERLIVVDSPAKWPLHVPDVHVVAADAYLTQPSFAELSGTKVLNLCRSFRHQSNGYYVSLLAAARGHRVLPSVETISDLRLDAVLRVAGEELDELIQQSLKPIKSETFELSIYFGRNMTSKYDRLCSAIFAQFPAPFLRAGFKHDGEWELDSLRVIGARDIPDSHHDFVVAQVQRHCERSLPTKRRKATYRYDLAMLVDENDELPCSNDKALDNFEAAAERIGIRPERIARSDYGRINEFDALFIRETTAVDNHTFRFARRAEAEGLVVVDDPASILRCCNKVFLAELLQRHRVPTPKSVIFNEDTVSIVGEQIGFPCVIKLPDSSFSVGVKKFETREAFEEAVPVLLEESDLLLAQEFTPTSFDWRIGVLDGQPLYACRYHMARKHWQIVKHQGQGKVDYGEIDTLPVEYAPPAIVKAAVRAADLIGNGLYGIDLKEIDGKPLVIEVNDNPSLDAGYEDEVLGDGLYDAVMGYFFRRLEEQRR